MIIMINLWYKYAWFRIIFFTLSFSIEKQLALTLCPTPVWSSKGTTIAGLESGKSGRTSSSLNRPTAVYITNNHNIYVLDSQNFRVQHFLPNSKIGTSIINSSIGTTLHQFLSMTDMQFDTNGNIYILDSKHARITKWTPGASTGILAAGGNRKGTAVNQVYEPGGMCVDSNTMHIWIADTENHRIVKWSSSTTSEVICGRSLGAQDDQFFKPQGVFIDTSISNKFYVADTNNHRIQMWYLGASRGITVAGITYYSGQRPYHLFFPKTLLVDTNDYMFIVDTGNDRIMKWKIGESTGVVIAGDVTSGTLSNQLKEPRSISFDLNGALFVADSDNNRIQKFDITCSTDISTIPIPIINMTASKTVRTSSISVTSPTTIQSSSTTFTIPTTVQSSSTVSSSSATTQKSTTSLVTTETTSSSNNYCPEWFLTILFPLTIYFWQTRCYYQ